MKQAPIRASRQFVADFDAVMAAFRVPPKEVEEVKRIARADMAAAAASFAETARLIRGGWKPCGVDMEEAIQEARLEELKKLRFPSLELAA